MTNKTYHALLCNLNLTWKKYLLERLLCCVNIIWLCYVIYAFFFCVMWRRQGHFLHHLNDWVYIRGFRCSLFLEMSMFLSFNKSRRSLTFLNALHIQTMYLLAKALISLFVCHYQCGKLFLHCGKYFLSSNNHIGWHPPPHPLSGSQSIRPLPALKFIIGFLVVHWFFPKIITLPWLRLQ